MCSLGHVCRRFHAGAREYSYSRHFRCTSGNHSVALHGVQIFKLFFVLKTISSVDDPRKLVVAMISVSWPNIPRDVMTIRAAAMPPS